MPVVPDPPSPSDRPGAGPRCWCCGEPVDPGRTVRLGQHPEVRLCLRCAHFVHQRAREIEDEDRRGPAVLVRDGLRRARAGVIRRGWHRSRLLGPGLRWLGRHLP